MGLDAESRNQTLQTIAGALNLTGQLDAAYHCGKEHGLRAGWDQCLAFHGLTDPPPARQPPGGRHRRARHLRLLPGITCALLLAVSRWLPGGLPAAGDPAVQQRDTTA